MAGGSLYERIRLAEKEDGNAPKTKWAWVERMQILCDVAEGMSQMHEHHYVHRDLKPDNVLLDVQGRAKVADLGLSQTHSSFDVVEIATETIRRQDSNEAATWNVGGTPQPVNIFCRAHFPIECIAFHNTG